MIDDDRIKTNYAEVEVGYLCEFVESLRECGVAAIVVIGPDVSCKNNTSRSILTMHPWRLHSAARKLCIKDDLLGSSKSENSALLGWCSLTENSGAASGWAKIWKQG